MFLTLGEAQRSAGRDAEARSTLQTAVRHLEATLGPAPQGLVPGGGPAGRRALGPGTRRATRAALSGLLLRVVITPVRRLQTAAGGRHEIATRRCLVGIALFGLVTQAADAQSLGTFRWQLQPYCNVLTVTVTQVGAVYRVEGTDDQCGAATRASVIGTAFQNPNGSIGFGLNVVAAPGGTAAPIDATIALATLSGTWRDSGGGSGTFAFTPGAGTGGSPRSAPTATVPAAIHLLTDGGLLAGGQLDLGTIPAVGAGTRMMWHPRKAAFRAGKVNGSEWDETNVGFFSTAFGQNPQAKGFAAVAMGNSAAALGDESVAIGPFALASGVGSVALGWAAVASNNGAIATGLQTLANGPRSTAMGHGTRASGEASTALGMNSIASGQYSLATGYGTTAGPFSIAGGQNSSALGDTSLAFGLEASAAGVGSVALGRTARTAVAGSGSFMFADRSTSAPFQSNSRQRVRRALRRRLLPLHQRRPRRPASALAPNGSSWAPLSDVNAKENFRDVDGEDLLAKLAAHPDPRVELQGAGRQPSATWARRRRTSAPPSGSATSRCASTPSTPTASRSPVCVPSTPAPGRCRRRTPRCAPPSTRCVEELESLKAAGGVR